MNRSRIAVARDLLTRERMTDTPTIRKDTAGDDHEKTLGNLAFNARSPSEAIRLREAIAQLVRKLKDTVACAGLPDIEGCRWRSS